MVGDQEAQVELDPSVRAVFSKSEWTLVYVYCEIICISNFLSPKGQLLSVFLRDNLYFYVRKDNVSMLMGFL